MLMQTHEARLDGLRKELARRGLDGFVIPISDEHMSEYVGSYAQRLNWLTGFGGSAGSAAVLQDRAAMFTDGRYTVQVREQVSGALYDYEDVPATSPAKWIAEHAPEGAKIGYDAWLHGIGWAEEAEAAFARRGIELVPVDGNPIDAIWDDRPQASLAAAVPHGDAHAGRSSADKRSEVADWLKQEGYDATVVSALDSVAWLLNMRGSDVDNTPVALSYVLAHADGTAELFIAPDKVTPELTQHLGNAVTVRDRAEFVPALEALDGKRVAVDPNHAVAGIFHALEQGGDNPHCRQHACAGVTDGGAWTDRRFIRHAIDSHGSAGRLCDHVEGKVVRIFTILREPFHLREDDPRVDFLQARPVETEPGKCAGCHVLDDDVGLFKHLRQKRLTCIRLEVAGHRALVEIVIDEVCRIDARHVSEAPAAGLAPLWLFDLHHVGAEPCKCFGAGRAGFELRQVDDFYAV